MRLATRGSPLARWQAELVAARLRRAVPRLDVELVVVETTGDRRQDRPLWEIGGQGVFVKEVQAAVLEGRADAAVHSAKDVPARSEPGLALAAVPERADPRDVLVGCTLDGLSPGATVATGSVRRRAQLAWLRPDLTFSALRGNIATRLERVPVGGAVVMAAAALDRLRLYPPVKDILDPQVMLPQVGQGAIAVECRADDEPAVAFLARIDSPAEHACLDAERAFLAFLGAGCDLPVGAYCRPVESPGGAVLAMRAMLASLDGRVMLQGGREFPAPDGPVAGGALAEELLAAGGRQLLSDAGMLEDADPDRTGSR